MIKSVFTFLTACLLMLLNGCSSHGVVPTVSAATPPAHPITLAHTIAICPDGCVGGESPGSYLALRIGPQYTVDETEFVYTLPYQMHVSQIDGWDDNGYGDVAETDTHLQIQFPDGTWTEFYIQYDRHSADLPGQVQRAFQTNLDLPIGTKLIMYHTAANCISPMGQCGYDSVWQLRSK